MNQQLSAMRLLEAESIEIFREVAAEYERPVLLYSVGKDSTVLLKLAQKAFAPAKIPFPLMHIDTGFKFPEMYAFRDAVAKRLGLTLIVERNEAWIGKGCDPKTLGVDECCRHLKTEALLEAMKKHGFSAAIGGARREEEKSRAKERVFSVRSASGGWNPREQRPEPWRLYNTELSEGQTMRIFPLSNWSELDIWRYIEREAVDVVPLYFSHSRRVRMEKGVVLPVMGEGEGEEKHSVRFRSLGCYHCTGAVESNANSVSEIIEELKATRHSERQARLIDHSGRSAMEGKKKEGYF